jgi:hypothetical protein
MAGTSSSSVASTATTLRTSRADVARWSLAVAEQKMCGFVSIYARAMATKTSARDEDVHLMDLNMMRARAMVTAPRARKSGGMITGMVGQVARLNTVRA